jgi:hypothetical protein
MPNSASQSAGNIEASPVYSIISTGCSMAGAQACIEALELMPDQVESQLSGVHTRPNPTLP